MNNPNEQHPTPEEIEAYEREEASWVDMLEVPANSERCPECGFYDYAGEYYCPVCGGEL